MKRVIEPKFYWRIASLMEAGFDDTEIADIFGCSGAVLARVKKKIDGFGIAAVTVSDRDGFVRETLEELDQKPTAVVAGDRAVPRDRTPKAPVPTKPLDVTNADAHEKADEVDLSKVFCGVPQRRPESNKARNT